LAPDVSRLVAAGMTYGLTGPLGKLSGRVVARASFSYPALWADFIDTIFYGQHPTHLNGYRLSIDHHLDLRDNVFVLGGPLHLTPAHSPFPTEWPVAVVAPGNGRLGQGPWAVLGEPFRPIAHVTPPWVLNLDPIGLYNPTRLPVADDPLTHLPLVGYRPEQGTEVVSATGRALNPPVPILPDASPVGLWTAPPEILVPLGAVRPLLSRAPISSIRVKVASVGGLGSGGNQRLQAVAAAITRATGLPVAIVRGASPEQILLHPGALPDFARLGWIATDWVRLGTASRFCGK